MGRVRGVEGLFNLAWVNFVGWDRGGRTLVVRAVFFLWGY